MSDNRGMAEPPNGAVAGARRAHGRPASALRPVSIETGVLKYAEGSAQITVGDTRVLVSASI